MNNSTSSIYFDVSNCTSETGDNSTSLFALPHFVKMLQAAVYIVEFILGISLSLFLIFLILFSKSLRQRGFAVALQILLANVAFAVPVLLTSAHAALAGDWILGDGACHFIAFCNQSFRSQRWLLTAVLVIDRALTIKRPLKYEKYGARVVAILSITAVLLGFLIGLVPTCILRQCTGYISALNTCQITSAQHGCAVFGFVCVTFLLTIGGVIPFFLYVWMFCKAKKFGRQILPANTTQMGTTASTTHASVSHKQLLTILLLFWTLIGCLLPQFIAFFLTYFSILSHLQSGIIVGFISIIATQPLYYALIIFDPIALMWHRDVKKELLKVKMRLRSILYGR